MSVGLSSKQATEHLFIGSLVQNQACLTTYVPRKLNNKTTIKNWHFSIMLWYYLSICDAFCRRLVESRRILFIRDNIGAEAPRLLFVWLTHSIKYYMKITRSDVANLNSVLNITNYLIFPNSPFDLGPGSMYCLVAVSLMDLLTH